MFTIYTENSIYQHALMLDMYNAYPDFGPFPIFGDIGN
jgi:hypothetical protein